MRLRYMFIPLAVAAAGLALPGIALAAPTKAGTESFAAISDINASGGPVIASGLIKDTGTDIVLSDTEDTFDFGAHGQITVFHSPVKQVQHVSTKKCTFSFTERGTYVFGNGTGEWTNYNGSGKYTAQGHATNACGDNPVGTVTITATGPINLSTND
jgi:hypothetical protein